MSSVIYPQTVRGAALEIANADGTTVKDLFTAGAAGSRVNMIGATSTDSSPRDLFLYVQIGGTGTNYLIGCVAVPAGSGNSNAVVAFDVMRNANLPQFCYDPAGNRYLLLPANAKLRVAAGTTVTSAKLIHLYAQGGDF